MKRRPADQAYRLPSKAFPKYIGRPRVEWMRTMKKGLDENFKRAWKGPRRLTPPGLNASASTGKFSYAIGVKIEYLGSSLYCAPPLTCIRPVLDLLKNAVHADVK